MTIHSILRKRILAPTILLCIMCSGCALPEVGPFVDATVELRAAVAASGSAVEAELRAMPDGQEHADKLRPMWLARAQAADALVAYASSLRAIVAAGEHGAESAKTLADSLKTLSGAVGIVVPPAGAAAVVSDTASFVYGHIARAQAAASLREALINAQPAVERITAHLALDLKDLRDVLVVANAGIVQKAKTDRQVEWGFRESLFGQQKKLYGKPAADLTAGEKAQLLEIDHLLATTNVWYEPLQKTVEQADMRLRTGLAVLNATELAITQWAYAHEQLVRAVRDNRAINVESLVRSATEVRALIERMHKL